MLAILGAVAVFAIDAHVQTTAGPRIVTADEAAVLGNVDCVLVLGCGVHPDGCPSDMLADRIAQGVALYENGTSPKLLMSGDHGRADYDLSLIHIYSVTIRPDAASINNYFAQRCALPPQCSVEPAKGGVRAVVAG